ncbi:MAG TPA: AAA family ATPase [Gemmata sp.]
MAPRTTDPRASERRTSDPRTILLDLALQSKIPATGGLDAAGNAYKRVQTLFNDLCAPHKLLGARRDALDEVDVYFNNGHHDYDYQGLSSGQRGALQMFIRFAAEHIHNSIVLVDELEQNQHPLWQRRLLHLLPRMGTNNQIIATTHSPYLRDAVPPDAVIELGGLGDGSHAEES